MRLSFRFFAQERLNLIIDEGTFESFSMNLRTLDPLKFEDKISYKERLKNAEKKTGKVDGTFYGTGKVFNKNVAIVVMDFEFMGGSMGVVVGEKVSKVLEESLEKIFRQLLFRAQVVQECRRGFSLLCKWEKYRAL